MGDTERFTPVNTCVASDFRTDVPEISEAKRLLAEYGSKYTIEPHLTLLLMPCTEEKFNLMKEELRNYLANLPRFVWKVVEIVYEFPRRFISLEISSDEITSIHEGLLAIASKYRTNELREKDVERIKAGKYSEEDIAQLKKYGFVFSGGRFIKHVTIGNIPEGVDADEVLKKASQVLTPIIGKDIVAREIVLMFHTDAPVQSEMQELVREVIKLK